MADIVERLRNFCVWNNRHSHYDPVPVCQEGALEIERLRADLKTAETTLADAISVLSDVVESWDWWKVDTYDRCQSVPCGAINDARPFLDLARCSSQVEQPQ